MPVFLNSQYIFNEERIEFSRKRDDFDHIMRMKYNNPILSTQSKNYFYDSLQDRLAQFWTKVKCSTDINSLLDRDLFANVLSIELPANIGIRSQN